MKGIEFERLARKYLLSKMPGFKVRKYLLFAHPFDYILRGYCQDPSAYSKTDFTVNIFAQPLFVPWGGVALTFGTRFGHPSGKAEEWWDLAEQGEEAIMSDIYKYILKEGQPFLDRFRTVDEFLRNAARPPFEPDHANILRPRAYAAVLLGDERLAKKLFDDYECVMASPEPLRDWEVHNLEEARLVRQTFQEDPGAAVNLLNSWRDQTVRSIGLTRFTKPMSPAGFPADPTQP